MKYPVSVLCIAVVLVLLINCSTVQAENSLLSVWNSVTGTVNTVGNTVATGWRVIRFGLETRSTMNKWEKWYAENKNKIWWSGVGLSIFVGFIIIWKVIIVPLLWPWSPPLTSLSNVTQLTFTLQPSTVPPALPNLGHIILAILIIIAIGLFIFNFSSKTISRRRGKGRRKRRRGHKRKRRGRERKRSRSSSSPRRSRFHFKRKSPKGYTKR